MPAEGQHHILFSSAAAANGLVAGVPAAARAMANLTSHGSGPGTDDPIVVAVPGGWQPDALCRAEAARLAPEATWSAADAHRALADEAQWFSGAALQLPSGSPQPVPSASVSAAIPGERAALNAAAQRIIKATGKPGDGIVSRHINRPISQAITALALRWPAMRPGHATFAAAAIGAAMIGALVLGGAAGLVAGAVLFQLASIIDGVDGEVARATQRSSARGAMLDSVTDAVTNLGFIAGVSWNLYVAGAVEPALAGAAGFALLALGTALLGLQSRRDGGPFTFDALKHRLSARPSRLKQWLTWLTMRDFYALAACLAIVAGWAEAVLMVFAAAALGWFAVLCWTLYGPRPAQP